MNREFKNRLIEFLGDLDESQLTGPQKAEASYLYRVLTKTRGAIRTLAEAGPDGKELAS